MIIQYKNLHCEYTFLDQSCFIFVHYWSIVTDLFYQNNSFQTGNENDEQKQIPKQSGCSPEFH